jgi:TolA-binding protein
MARHLDGWQAGAVAVLLAASAVFLAVPRAVEPKLTPVPLIDRKALDETMARDDELARLAEAKILDVDIRTVGRELRRFNRAVAEGKLPETALARRALVAATRIALRRDEQELLALRAYQTRQFVAEIRNWQRTGEATAELDELGGAFLLLARQSRWCTGDQRQLLPDEVVLRAFFKKRWNEITGASRGPFALTLNEDRARFGFLLRHPMAQGRADRQSPPGQELRQRAQDQLARLEIVTKLGQLDPEYPAALARGVMLYQMKRFGQAAQAFRQHLDLSPDGPHALRAQNYLKATLDRTREGLL